MSNEKVKNAGVKPAVRIRQAKASEIKNDALKDALNELKADRTRQNEIAMFSHLQKAQLLVPVQFAGSPENLQIKFIMINTKDGKSFFPAFTDEEEANKLQLPEGATRQYLVRGVREYGMMFKDPKNKTEGIVLNPFSGNIVLPKNVVLKLSQLEEVKEQNGQQLKQNQIPAGANVTFSEPRIYPTRMVNAVHDYCMEKEEVERVWFKQMLGGNVVSFALIVETKSEDEQLLNDIREVAVPEAKDMPVVVLKYTEDLEKKALANSIPLYDKELGM